MTLMLASASAQLSRAASALRSAPADASTPESRARERHRRLVLSAGTAALAKIVSVLSVLVTVPLTLHYLGPERYGLWMVISSFAVVFSFADLGVGNGLLSAVADAHGRNDRSALERHVASAYIFITLLAAALLMLGLAAASWVAWPELLNVTSAQASAEARPAVQAFIVCFALGIPLTLVQRIQTGLQEGFRANLWQCVASLAGLVALLLVIELEGSLPWLVCALLGAPALVSALNTWTYFARPGKSWRPHWRQADLATGKRVVATGAQFLVLQLALGVAFAADSFLISQVLGSAAVANYAVPEKLFAVLSSAVALAVSPLWPAYGEALARGDQEWAKQTLRRSIAASALVAGAGGLALVVLAKPLLSLWVGQLIDPPLLLLAGLAVLKVQEAVGSAIAMYANGRGLLRQQVLLHVVLLAIAIPLKWSLIAPLGVAGTPLAMNVAYLACVLIPWIVTLRTVVLPAANARGRA